MHCDAKLYKRQVLIKLSDVAKFLYHDKEFVDVFLLQLLTKSFKICGKKHVPRILYH